MTDITERILQLKTEKKAVLLVHNYQSENIQKIADFLGDSLDLSRKARDVDSNTIVFCGVDFMAETAKILAPQKTILHPVKEANCPMAMMVTAADVLALRAEHPEAMVVCYVNSTAEVKAVSDVCCTSANAVKVVQNIPAQEIIFVPDKNLGSYVQRFTDKKIILWKGYCYVHDKMRAADILKTREKHPQAVLVVHPECLPEVIDIADYVESTSGMLRLAREIPQQEFLIATEFGLIQRLAREIPEKTFISAVDPRVCATMKKITLNDIWEALDKNQHQVELSTEIMDKARGSLERMLLWV